MSDEAWTEVLKVLDKMQADGVITAEQAAQYLDVSYAEYCNLVLSYISSYA